MRFLATSEPLGSETWGHFEEPEAATQRIVENSEAAVSSVHHANDVNVGWDRETLVFVEKSELSPTFIALDKHEQFSEDLGDVASVDLVDDEEVGAGWIVCSRVFAESVERSFGESEPAGFSRTIPHKEVLIGIALMELNDLDPAAVLFSDY